MLTYQDCVELSDLTEDEIEAIAQHEHLPEMAALEMGSYLVHTPEGIPMIKRIILDDIEEARRHGHDREIAAVEAGVETFCRYPPKQSGQSLNGVEGIAATDIRIGGSGSAGG